jgi:hypothetical protein
MSEGELRLEQESSRAPEDRWVQQGRKQGAMRPMRKRESGEKNGFFTGSSHNIWTRQL